MLARLRNYVEARNRGPVGEFLRIRPAARVLPGVLIATIVIGLWSRPHFLWNEPPLWVVLVALGVLVTGLRRVQIWALVWWLLGITSLLWTLTPAPTLVAALWALTYTAAWAAGGTPCLLGASLVVLLADGLFSTVSLQLYGLAQYFSGSVAYLTGAVALVLLPIAWKSGIRRKSWWGRVAALLLSALATYAALTSGSRAVYLVLVLIFPIMVARMARRAFIRSAVSLAMIALLVASLNALLPGNPVGDAVGVKVRSSVMALSLPSATPAASPSTASTTGVEDGIRSRLKMWDQTARIGLTHPFGTGLGSFRDVVVGFQRFPTINFSSAHNVGLEIFATQGWLGLILLLGLLFSSLGEGWKDPHRWPFALGAAALWLTMCFDVTWSMPVMPLLAFWSLSVSRGQVDMSGVEPRIARTVRHAVLVLVPVVAVFITAWWYAPCTGASCVVARHLGYLPEATSLVQQASAPRRQELLTRLERLYPRSVWVWYLASTVASSPSAKLAADRALVSKFPLASPIVYLDLANLELDQGNVAAARQVLHRGLEVFPPGLSPAGVPLVSKSRAYAAWIEGARTLGLRLQP